MRHRKLKRILAKTVPSWVNCKLNSASFELQASEDSGEMGGSDKMCGNGGMGGKDEDAGVLVIGLWENAPAKRLSTLHAVWVLSL